MSSVDNSTNPAPRADSPPAVFISYCHESVEHRQRVWEFCAQLRASGIDATIDQYAEAPAEGFPRWMEARIQGATFVLVVCTKGYFSAIDPSSERVSRRGVMWEASLIYQQIYEAGTRNHKFIPVLFSGATTEDIPLPLRPYMYYRVDTTDGYRALCKRLLGSGETCIPAVIAVPTTQESLPAIPSVTDLHERMRARSLDVFRAVNTPLTENDIASAWRALGAAEAALEERMLEQEVSKQFRSFLASSSITELQYCAANASALLAAHPHNAHARILSTLVNNALAWEADQPNPASKTEKARLARLIAALRHLPPLLLVALFVIGIPATAAASYGLYVAARYVVHLVFVIWQGIRDNLSSAARLPTNIPNLEVVPSSAPAPASQIVAVWFALVAMSALIGISLWLSGVAADHWPKRWRGQWFDRIGRLRDRILDGPSLFERPWAHVILMLIGVVVYIGQVAAVISNWSYLSAINSSSQSALIGVSVPWAVFPAYFLGSIGVTVLAASLPIAFAGWLHERFTPSYALVDALVLIAGFAGCLLFSPMILVALLWVLLWREVLIIGLTIPCFLLTWWRIERYRDARRGR
jgi:SEFIR domain